MSIEGHPPAANCGPEITLPDTYRHTWDWQLCPVCDGGDGQLCPDCVAEMREGAAVDEARARWEES